LRGLWAFAIVRGRLAEARDLAGELFDIARRSADDSLMLEACYHLGGTHFYLGEPRLACEHSEQGIALYDPVLHRSHTLLYGTDPGVTCRCYAALALWLMGHPDQALVRVREARSIAENTEQAVNIVFALTFGAILHQLRGDVEATSDWAGAAAALAAEQVLPFWAATARIFLGWAWFQMGRIDDGVAAIEHGLAENRAAGAEVGRPKNCTLLAEVLVAKGASEAALAALADAFDAIATSGASYEEAELHRLRGEALLTQVAQGDDNSLGSEVESCFRRGIEVARQQGARALELRSAMSLGRLLLRRGRPQEAGSVLEPIYESFTEGLDTVDLKAARDLLARLR
jgi:predicted ATPase